MKKLIFVLFLITSLTMFGCAATMEDKAITEEETTAASLSKLAKKLEKKLHVPTMVDDETELVGIEGFDHEVQYNYKLVNYSSKDLDSTKFMKIMKEQVQKDICAKKEIKPLLKANIKLSFTYKGNDNKRIGKISITKDMCR